MATQGKTRSLTILIPAYHEIVNLRALLPEIAMVRETLADITLEVSVIISTDATANEIDEIHGLGASALVRQPTDSFGDAIRTGIASLGDSVDFVVFMDADGSHSPARIPDLLHHAPSADVVVASRYTKGGSSANGLVLKLMSLLLNRAYSLILGINCRDVSTNYKLYRAGDLRVLRLECNNFDIVEEILFRLQRLKRPAQLQIIEVPDFFAQRRSGHSKRRLGPYIASYLWTLGRLRFGVGRGWSTRGHEGRINLNGN